MSYRTIKKLLGENSLERKCRFLFGGALMILIGASFWFYSQLNLKVIRNQYRQRAKLLLALNLNRTHWLQSLESSNVTSPSDENRPPQPFVATEIGPPSASKTETDLWNTELIGTLSTEFKPEDLQEDNWFFFRNAIDARSEKRPGEIDDNTVWNRLYKIDWKNPPSEDQTYDYREDEINKKYLHYEPVTCKSSCVDCHRLTQKNLNIHDLMYVA